MIVIPKLKLGYQNIPKVGTTSLFDWLLVAHEGEINEQNVLPGQKNRRRKFFKKGDAATTVENKVENISDVTDYYRFAIIRDPVKRFLSMYSNRIVQRRQLSAKSKDAKNLLATGLKYDPQVNELVTHLDEYLKASGIIYHHTRPQMDYLGPDISVYTRIVDISKINEIVGEIRDFWLGEGLVDIYDRAPSVLPHNQTGGPKLGLNVLTPESFEKLLAYYAEDYEKLPGVSLQAIKDEYENARALGEGEPIVFEPLSNKGVSKESSQASKPIKVKKEKSPIAEMLKIKLPDEIKKESPFVLKGALVLNAEIDPSDWTLFVEDDAGKREVEMGLGSPALHDRFPENINASKARFKIAGVKLSATNPVKLYLESSVGQHLLLATISQ